MAANSNGAPASSFAPGLFKVPRRLSLRGSGQRLPEEFLHELTAINLRRGAWLLGSGILLTLAAIAVTRLDRASQAGDAAWVLWIDLASAVAALFANQWIRGLPQRSRVRPVFVAMLVVVFLAYMDAYYFVRLASFGQSPNYVLGVVITGALFLLRPRLFIPLFALNHAIFCVLLFSLAPRELPLLLALVENTTGATIAGLTAWLLFRTRHEEYSQRKALEKRNTELNDIMAITAHDLRSPLLGLRDLLSLAGSEAPGERTRGALHLARTSCGQMLALIGRLLDAHAAEQQAENSVPLEQDDVRALLEAAAERARRDFSTSNVAIRCELPLIPAPAAVNRPAFDQAIDNLLSNAMRFSPPGSEVVARLYPDDQSWCCDVIDQGPGIPEGERQALFKKFFRGSRRPATHEAGSGLGLFIAATCMRTMRGSVECVPNQPQGAVFRLRFPAAG